jgi:small-conductance mechanosensitive channel
MSGFNDSAWLVALFWAVIIIAGYPLVTIILSELTRRQSSEEGSDVIRFFRMLQYTVLPAVVTWILIHKLISLPSGSVAVKMIDTVVGIVVLYAILLIAQAVLIALRSRIDGGGAAPKLFYELGGLVIAVVGGAMIISTVWDIKLGTLFGALGVGSVVLGLALQSVIGGLANGLIVLSGRHFAIGDWLEVGGTFAKVVQVDWRSVTLLDGAVRLVVPSSQLSSSTLRIRHKNQPIGVKVSLTVSPVYSPDQVKCALIEAANSVDETVAGSASSTVDEFGAGGLQYSVAVSVDDPSKAGQVRANLLDRLWYVCRRHGISVLRAADDAEPPVEKRAQLLTESGALREPIEGLDELAAAAAIQRYGRGEYLLRRSEPANTVFILVAGKLSMSVETLAGPIVVEQFSAGQLFAIREVFRNGASPVDLTADCESDVVAIPAAAMDAMLDKNRKLAVDLELVIGTRADLIKTTLAREGSAPGRLHRIA